jgi:hypothetical protein
LAAAAVRLERVNWLLRRLARATPRPMAGLAMVLV